MTGATGNVYCGLHDFQDMALMLHALRPGDLFVDVGSNVGTYSILAAGVAGANVMAIEPIPITYEALLDNIFLNRLNHLISAKNMGIGSFSGSVQFTDSLDAVNHVLTEQESRQITGITVQQLTLDGLLAGSCPTVLKIDVEGYETEVIKGGIKTLSDASLLAIIIELIGCGSRYGHDEICLRSDLIQRGFIPCVYDPWERKITVIDDNIQYSYNTLFVRDIKSLQTRVDNGLKISILGHSI